VIARLHNGALSPATALPAGSQSEAGERRAQQGATAYQ